jgi:hypothetical protein
MKLSLDDAYDDDFGFSAVSEEELKALEKRLAEDVKQKSKQLEDIETTYKGKLEQLYRAVMPLLHNLAANPEKEYIYWPNRTEKVKGFIDRVNAIVNE